MRGGAAMAVAIAVGGKTLEGEEAQESHALTKA
jgi:hypothetical protein